MRCRARDRVATEEAWFVGSMSGMPPPGIRQGSGMFDDDCDEATVLAACRDGPRFSSADIGTFAEPHWFFGDVAPSAPHLKSARSRIATWHTPIIDWRCGAGPGPFRVLRDGLETATGLTTDGRHA